MQLRDKPELQDRLASEYVLGTLRGPARLRFQRHLREDANLRIAVDAWQARLMPMAAAVEPVAPPKRVWEVIARRTAGAAPVTASNGLWNSLGFWRNFGLLASGVAAALLAAVILVRPQAPVPAPQIARAPASELPAAYLAVISDPKTMKPVLLVSATRNSDRLMIKRLDASINVPEKSLELWALPAGQAPRSLGLVGAEEKHTLKLNAVADQALGNVPLLAVSLEPSGGSPSGAPTGPVLYSGPCLHIW
jgi:anti-sigma-K factor RskA